MNRFEDDGIAGVIDLYDPQDEEMAPPSRWAVLFHNDDYTPIHLVITLLINIFELPLPEAEAIARKIHQTGLPGQAGVYPRGIALMKSGLTESITSKLGHPLKTELREMKT